MVDTPIGTNSPNYTLVSGDVGATIFCRVRATNVSGSADAFSNAVGPVVAAGGGDTSAPAMTNLWTWLKADAGTFADTGLTTPATTEGATVNGWDDQSPGARNFFEASGSPEGPILHLGAFSGAPNSKPFLHFDQSGVARLFIGPSAAALTAGEIFIVVKARTDASGPPQTQNALWGFGSIATQALYPYAGGSIYDDWGRADARPSTGTPAIPLTDWHLYNVVTTGSAGAAEWTSFLNNVQHYTTSTSTVGFMTAPVLGGDPTATQGFDGFIAEVVMYSAKCSAPDKLQTVTYLSDKYALGIV